jgi:hypothetical protein
MSVSQVRTAEIASCHRRRIGRWPLEGDFTPGAIILVPLVRWLYRVRSRRSWRSKRFRSRRFGASVTFTLAPSCILRNSLGVPPRRIRDSKTLEVFAVISHWLQSMLA